MANTSNPGNWSISI